MFVLPFIIFTSFRDRLNQILYIAHEFIRGEKLKEMIKINTLGESMFTVETQCIASLHRIDISHLPEGIYFIKIGNFTEKFIVVR